MQYITIDLKKRESARAMANIPEDYAVYSNYRKSNRQGTRFQTLTAMPKFESGKKICSYLNGKSTA